MTSPTIPVADSRTRIARIAHRPWAFGPLAGALIGLPILGIGSRIAMRLVALGTNRPGAFTVEGSLTVLFYGVLAGAAGGMIYAVIARLLAHRAVARSLIFLLIIVLLTLRGVAPATVFTLSLFLPVTLAYAMLLDLVWRRSAVGRLAATP